MASLKSKPLGVWMCSALVVGNIIGWGVFLLPASLAPYGWNAVFAWMLTIGGSLCLAYVFAKLAGAFSRAGGPLAHTEGGFGRAPGFLVAWAYLVSGWGANAALALAAIAGDAGQVVDQRQLPPDQPVEQRRLADIGPADDGDRE